MNDPTFLRTAQRAAAMFALLLSGCAPVLVGQGPGPKGVDGGVRCGSIACGAGEYCCNASCGVCAPIGAACIQVACVDDAGAGDAGDAPGACLFASGRSCPVGATCPSDDGCNTCTCTANGGLACTLRACAVDGGPIDAGPAPDGGIPCGSSTCSSGEYCCNAGCGLCTRIGALCIQITCADAGSADARSADAGPAECAAGACGPALGIPNYICSDGSTGGPTGRCMVQSDGHCGWEVRSCPTDGSPCSRDADCRAYANYCNGCSCDALSVTDAPPACNGQQVACLVDPCQGRTAYCNAGHCALQ